MKNGTDEGGGGGGGGYWLFCFGCTKCCSNSILRESNTGTDFALPPVCEQKRDL